MAAETRTPDRSPQAEARAKYVQVSVAEIFSAEGATGAWGGAEALGMGTVCEQALTALQ